MSLHFSKKDFTPIPYSPNQKVICCSKHLCFPIGFDGIIRNVETKETVRTLFVEFFLPNYNEYITSWYLPCSDVVPLKYATVSELRAYQKMQRNRELPPFYHKIHQILKEHSFKYSWTVYVHDPPKENGEILQVYDGLKIYTVQEMPNGEWVWHDCAIGDWRYCDAIPLDGPCVFPPR